jgi:hypothetical protein
MALELAIISESKNFLSSPACQKLVAAIHIGRIIYTPSSPIDILPDHYKYRPIALYEPRKAPLLNQYRLIVPRTRNILEVCQFAVLLLLYLLVMGNRDSVRFTGYELVFCAYAFGWALDQFASILEHGWQGVVSFPTYAAAKNSTSNHSSSIPLYATYDLARNIHKSIKLQLGRARSNW